MSARRGLTAALGAFWTSRALTLKRFFLHPATQLPSHSQVMGTVKPLTNETSTPATAKSQVLGLRRISMIRLSSHDASVMSGGVGITSHNERSLKQGHVASDRHVGSVHGDVACPASWHGKRGSRPVGYDPRLDRPADRCWATCVAGVCSRDFKPYHRG